MKTSFLSFLSYFFVCSSAVRIPFSQSKRGTSDSSFGGAKFSVSQPTADLSGLNVLVTSSNGNDSIDLSTTHDLIYIANVTVGGVEYPVQLDTGSSDMWIKGSSTPLPNANQTSTTYNLTYGIGWAYGHISYAAVEIAGINIPSQALLDVSSASNPALSYGADGILGLGFTSLSTIDSVVNQTGGSTGRSPLYNAFLDNPSDPNFIAFALQRSTDPSDDVVGSFSIGEYDPAYASVANTTAIPTWPITSPNRWNVLLDSFIVGTETIFVSSNVTGAPSNKAVVSLDTGTSYTYCTTDVANAIYGGVSGASYQADLGQWVVPCDAEIDIALQIGGNVFPIHPLDVVPTSLTDPTTCVGSFIPQSVSVGGGEFDWLLGDNVLRSLYSVYDFGDFDSAGNIGNPYIKLLSLVDPDQASADFHSVRGGVALSNITYNASNNTSSGSTTVTLSSSLADSLDKIVGYIPAMLAILGLNALLLVVLTIVGICFMLQRKRRRAGKGRRSEPNTFSAMPLDRTSNVPSVNSYQPVSVGGAEPEDAPFTPPTPAFHSTDGEPRRGSPGVGPRPHSMFTTTSGPPPIPRAYRVSAAGSSAMGSSAMGSSDNLFTPPSPGYMDGDRDRPKSMA